MSAQITSLNTTGGQLGMNTMMTTQNTSTFIPNADLNGGLSNCLPWYPTQSTYSYPYYPFQIRAVKNGFIVSINGNEHVFLTAEEVGKFVAAQLSEFLPK
jgi:hypothetical protein